MIKSAYQGAQLTEGCPRKPQFLYYRQLKSTPMTNKRIAVTTAGTREEAEKIANHLVNERMAACVNIVPGLTSVYRWQGKVAQANEFLLLIKTSTDHLAAVEAAIAGLHSYQVPEFVVLSIESGSAPYLAWLDESLS